MSVNILSLQLQALGICAQAVVLPAPNGVSGGGFNGGSSSGPGEYSARSRDVLETVISLLRPARQLGEVCSLPPSSVQSTRRCAALCAAVLAARADPDQHTLAAFALVLLLSVEAQSRWPGAPLDTEVMHIY